MVLVQICACLALLLGVVLTPDAAFAQGLQVDLDADGVRDQVDTGARRQELIVRISVHPGVQHLRTRDAIVGFAAADVNRDGHTDLVATTTRKGLRVWLNSGRGRFVQYLGLQPVDPKGHRSQEIKALLEERRKLLAEVGFSVKSGRYHVPPTLHR